MSNAAKDGHEPAHRTGAQAATTGNGGWLSAVRARLGLAPSVSLRGTIEDALKKSRDGTAFSEAEREMLQRTLRFGTLRVDDIMVPRSDIIAVDESESIHSLLQTFDEAGVSRIPVFRETLDDPRGMVHIKDLLRWLMGDAAGRPVTEGRSPTVSARPKPAETPALRNGNVDGKADLGKADLGKADLGKADLGKADLGKADLGKADLGKADLGKSIAAAKLRRAVLFVPPSMPLTNLLIRMQTTRIHMALVVDEYGGTDGLVTIEDLVEQIVGEIDDEHDEIEAANIVVDANQGVTAAARTPVKELEAQLKLKLLSPEQEEDIDTLGGLVFALVGHVPARGELVPHPAGIEFEVLDADARRVKRVKIHRSRKPNAASATPALTVP